MCRLACHPVHRVEQSAELIHLCIGVQILDRASVFTHPVLSKGQHEAIAYANDVVCVVHAPVSAAKIEQLAVWNATVSKQQIRKDT
jgi:hypothetical protein